LLECNNFFFVFVFVVVNFFFVVNFFVLISLDDGGGD
jgi:hypothetical protein